LSLAGVRGAVLVFLAAGRLAAQELEPRALQNAPVGVHFAIAAVGYARGNLLFDPALPLEDAKADVGSVTTGLVRAVGIFGRSGRVGLIVPFVTGRWRGTLAGADTSTSRTGFADPRVLFAINFLGAPALTLTEMRGYRQSTVAGLQLVVSMPLGQYFPERLINLGSHRWAFAPRLGVSQQLGQRWTVEAYGGATFFTRNGDFYGGSVRTQEPFFEAQAHTIYVIRYPDVWVAASAGYGWGGRATVAGTPKEPLHNTRASAVLRLPIARQHGLKLVYINGLTTKLGADFDTVQIAYQYTFGRRR